MLQLVSQQNRHTLRYIHTFIKQVQDILTTEIQEQNPENYV